MSSHTDQSMEPLALEAMQALVLQHQDFLRALARNVAKTLPRHVDFEELVAYGQLGLLDAAQRFEPARGFAFTTFAHYRIRGAIFDGLHKLIGLPASIRRRIDADRAVDGVLESRGPAAIDSEDPDELTRDLCYAVDAAGIGFLVHDAVDDTRPDDALERDDSLARLRTALEELEQDERSLIRAVYFDGHSMTEIAQMLGVHKATVSRTHARIMERLRIRLSGAECDGTRAA